MSVSELDAFIRRQAYLEGYRNHEAGQFNETGLLLASIIISEVLRVKVDNLGDLTKKELNVLIARVRKRVTKELKTFIRLKTADLKKFLAIEFNVDKQLFGAFTDKKLTGKSMDGTRDGLALLWASMENEPVPGTGREPIKILPLMAAGFTADFLRLIRLAYANRMTVDQFIKELQGTKANNNKDGLLNKLNNRYATDIQTYIQHIGAFVLGAIGSKLFETYEWVSVLDSRTTDICLSRNGKIYPYATGPRPPAHYNCRSTIIPVTAFVPVPTYYEWIQRQPVAVQDDILGKSRGVRLRKGEFDAKTLPKFDGSRPLTAKQYGEKINRMLTAA